MDTNKNKYFCGEMVKSASNNPPDSMSLVGDHILKHKFRCTKLPPLR